MITGTQKQLYDWLLLNFGQGVSKERLLTQQLAGMIEELGELTHSVLKLEQKIRQDENHIANLEDAIGDILVFMSNVLSLCDINLNCITLRRIDELSRIDTNPFNNIFEINSYIAQLIANIKQEDFDEAIKDVIYLYNNLQIISFLFLKNKNCSIIFTRVADKVLKRNWNEHRKEHNTN